jgi:hypothetical protein
VDHEIALVDVRDHRTIWSEVMERPSGVGGDNLLSGNLLHARRQPYYLSFHPDGRPGVKMLSVFRWFDTAAIADGTLTTFIPPA